MSYVTNTFEAILRSMTELCSDSSKTLHTITDLLISGLIRVWLLGLDLAMSDKV